MFAGMMQKKRNERGENESEKMMGACGLEKKSAEKEEEEGTSKF